MGYAFILEPRHAGWRCLPLVSPDQETLEHVASRVRLLFSDSQGLLSCFPGTSAAKVNATIANFELPTGSGRGQITVALGFNYATGHFLDNEKGTNFLTIQGDAIIEFLLGRHGSPAHTERTFAKLKC